jgi:hypothetical protein
VRNADSGRLEVLQQLRAVACTASLQKLSVSSAARLEVLRQLRHACIRKGGYEMNKTKFVLLVASAFMLVATVTWQPISSVKAGAGAAYQEEPTAQEPPSIMNAAVLGKKLYIAGEGFGQGAVVLLNGEEQKTKRDPDSPTTMLIAKKAGKKVGSREVVALEVRNGDGQTSSKFAFFGGRVVTLADDGVRLSVKIGDRFLLALGSEFMWQLNGIDFDIVTAIPTQSFMAGTQGLYEGTKLGQFTITAKGDPTCRLADPPCLRPGRMFTINIVVE